MIPENKRIAVKKALLTAFGTDHFDDIVQITKGLSSALIFKIVVHEKSYLLRIIMRDDAMADPSFYFACMKNADEGGIGPRIHYISNEDRISITDFINAQPFPIDVARNQLAQLLKRLHTLPKFPFRLNYFDAMEKFNDRFLSLNILPVNETKEIYELYQQIACVYPKNDKDSWVSCHNDLKPENIIFDGERPWFVDWEGAFLNDRYLDLNIIANFVVRNEQEETVYLETYFGEPVDEYKRSQFFVMQQMLHVYYFTFFMMTGAAGKPVDISAMAKNDYKEFHNRIWYGDIDLANNDLKIEYALLHRNEFLHNMKTTRMQTSLQCLKN